MTTWTESEREFAGWMERRFPEGGPADERLRRADRRRFWRPEPVGLALLVVGVLADPADKRRLVSVTGPVHPWQVACWIVAGAVLAVAITVAVRRRMRTGMWRSWILEGLTREQRRELEAEVRGLRPVVPGDEPALDQIARQWVAGALDAAFAAALALALLPVAISDPGGWVGAFRFAVLAYLAGAALWSLARASQGRTYLRRTAHV